MNFEAVEKQIAQHDSDAILKEGKFVEIYKIAKPVLLLISKLPVLPKKWRTIIKGLITSLDILSN